MTLTPTAKVERPKRHHVVGFILTSLAVGVIGLVAAISMTVSGIMTTFTEVNETYVDVFETGVEIGPTATPVDLDDANYAVLSFSESRQQPSFTEQAQACTIVDEHGDEVATDTSIRQLSETDLSSTDPDISDANYVVYTHFEASQGTYVVSCQEFGLLSDGGSNNVGGTTIWGIGIGIGSMIIAAGLFIMGLVNSSRNRAAQRENPKRFIDYRLDYS